jgi:hypothetical protein
MDEMFYLDTVTQWNRMQKYNIMFYLLWTFNLVSKVKTGLYSDAYWTCISDWTSVHFSLLKIKLLDFYDNITVMQKCVTSIFLHPSTTNTKIMAWNHGTLYFKPYLTSTGILDKEWASYKHREMEYNNFDMLF